MPAIERPLFDGDTYEPLEDAARLGTQIERVYALMCDRNWRSLTEIAETVNGTEASVSARLRDLRKPWWGGHTVARRRVARGLFEYRLDPALCGLLDGQRDSNPKIEARRNIEAFLEWWDAAGHGDQIIFAVGDQPNLTVSDLREMLR